MDIKDALHKLEAFLGLHSRFEIHYYVDHYKVVWHHENNDLVLSEGEGETIEDALINLAENTNGG